MIGSLDIGKDATFFISETPPMEMNPKILMAFIQGKEVISTTIRKCSIKNIKRNIEDKVNQTNNKQISTTLVCRPTI